MVSLMIKLYFAELYGLAVAVALTVTALIILSVVLVIVIIKCQRRKKVQRVSQGEMDHRSCQEAKSEPPILIYSWFQQSMARYTSMARGIIRDP